MSFDKDLTNGKIYEHKVCKYIQRKYPDAYVVDGENKEGDIFINSIFQWVEVKYDRLVGKTHNFFLECEYEGEPSGIVTSQSDWWALCDSTTAYVLPLEVIRTMVRGMRTVPLVIQLKSVKGYLIPEDKIKYSPYVHVWKLV